MCIVVFALNTSKQQLRCEYYVQRSICDEFEEMSQHASERPKETPEVVALQNYINMCREDKIFALKQEIKQTAERVMFLLYNADVDGK